jgi:hypothetical protein
MSFSDFTTHFTLPVLPNADTHHLIKIPDGSTLYLRAVITSAGLTLYQTINDSEVDITATGVQI